MALDLYAGIPVTDHQAAPAWYERLFGSPPVYGDGETEAVRESAGRRRVFVEVCPERAGRAMSTVFVDDPEAGVAGACPGGVREAVFRGPEGAGFPFGGAAL
ncbi:VOC family protein [Nocardiopsis tropica]|uniref:VOC family protein n=1 Tax=Nocardiopsis tropica TaxID=109330 RepID=A0ABV1ZP72_9ACTN